MTASRAFLIGALAAALAAPVLAEPPPVVLSAAEVAAAAESAAALEAAAAGCLAAAPAVVRDSVTVTCAAGGTNAFPRRGTDAAGQVVTTCTGTGLVVTTESTADHPCAAYIRALATSDAPTESGE